MGPRRFHGTDPGRSRLPRRLLEDAGGALGVGGGDAGGRILFAGPPEALAEADTATAAFLRDELERDRRAAPLGAEAEEERLDLDALVSEEGEPEEEEEPEEATEAEG